MKFRLACRGCDAVRLNYAVSQPRQIQGFLQRPWLVVNTAPIDAVSVGSIKAVPFNEEKIQRARLRLRQLIADRPRSSELSLRLVPCRPKTHVIAIRLAQY